ncbi:MAG: DUF971 domain-containing protein [Massilia sp.]
MSSDSLDVGSVWPSAVTLDVRARTLELVWDGVHAVLPHGMLRAACRCTECESVRRGLKKGKAPAPDVVLTALELVGSVGLQLFFSDGHERGIYPWPYLRELAAGPAIDQPA